MRGNITESFQEVFGDILEFKIADLVYVKTDPDQYKRIVLGFELNSNGLIYKLGIDDNVTTHYTFELQKEKIVF